jgi:hypothetical protein
MWTRMLEALEATFDIAYTSSGLLLSGLVGMLIFRWLCKRLQQKGGKDD